jgi:hypothetical protein
MLSVWQPDGRKTVPFEVVAIALFWQLLNNPREASRRAEPNIITFYRMLPALATSQLYRLG